MLSLVLLVIFAHTFQADSADIAARQEMKRLEACHPSFKLSPPPIHMRFVWTQPFDLAYSAEGKDRLSIEFSVQYAQSENFATEEDAAKTQAFNPIFNLRQRNHYVVEGDHLRLVWRESFLNSHWKRQSSNQPEFACWQTIPGS